MTPAMKILRPIAILASLLMLTANATAQLSLTPPAQTPPPAANKPAAKPKPKPVAKKPAAVVKPATPPPTATVIPAPAPDDPNVDLVFGAYQRGLYKTAYELATKRAEQTGDPRR